MQKGAQDIGRVPRDGAGCAAWRAPYGQARSAPFRSTPPEPCAVMFYGKAPKAHVRVGTVKVDTDRVVARQEPEAKRG